MNNIRKLFSKILMIHFVFAIGGLLCLQGCGTSDHAVLAATGTVIGVELSQNPATQIPQGKLGYNRAEFAYVPTNRGTPSGGKSKGSDGSGNGLASTGNGAEDTAEVIMEIKYSDIFSSGAGIYQRLAIGKTAVQQPGARFMFAKDSEGKISDETAKALGKIQSIPSTAPDIILGKTPIRTCHDEDQTKKDAVEKAITDLGFGSYEDFMFNTNVTQDQINNLKKKLASDCTFG